MFCWPSVSAKRGASLVITRRVVNAEYGWTFGHLLLVKYTYILQIIIFMPTYQPTFQLVSVQETKDLVEEV